MAAIFFRRGLPVDVVVAAERPPERKAADWSEQKRLSIDQVEEDWFVFGPPAFQAEISERVGRGEKPWTG